MPLRETSDRKRAAASVRRSAEVPHDKARTAGAGSTSLPLMLISTPGTLDAASSHAGLLDVARTLLFHLQYCNRCPEREYLVLKACVVRLDAALAVGVYPYLLDICADDLAAQISRIRTGGFPCSARRLRRVG